MPERLTAALASMLALLVAASTLAVVASPASAHSQTKTVRRCAYDPFTNTNQCWNETVSVSHTHSCGAGMTGTYPNCYPAPSTNQQNKGDEEAKKRAEEARKEAERKAAEEAERKRKEAEAAEEAERQRKAQEEAERKHKEAEKDDEECPAGKVGTPPDCVDQHSTTHVVTCSPVQDPLEVVQRHKHGVGGTCHRQDHSHCPAGQTEVGAHGSGDCREDDAPDNVFTRIQHLLGQGGKAALDAIIETLKNEAADQLENLDIDWENFGTDGDAQQKLLDVLNPILQQNDIEIYTIDDVKDLWADIGVAGRGGAGAAACYAAVEAAMAKLTKGKSLKKEARHAAAGLATTVCGGTAAAVPVPDDDAGDETDDDDAGDDGDGQGGDDDAGDGGEPKLTPAEAYRRALRAWIADPSPANAAARQEAAERYKAALCRQGQKAYC